MALVKEDGTGVADANTYNDVADLDTFMSDRQIVAWATTDQPTKERCAIEAAEYLDAFYPPKSDPLKTTQGLAWPRETLGLPGVVVKAHALLTSEALSGTLAPSSEGGEVASVSESLAGVGSTSTTYRQGRETNERRFPLVDQLLKGYTSGPVGSGVTTIRRTL